MTTLFPLKEETIDIRGRKVRVRELTQNERSEIAKMVSEDKFVATAAFAVKGCIDPPITLEQAANESAEIIGLIAKTAMRLSGIGRDDDEKKGEAKND